VPTITIKTEAGGWFPYPREAIEATSGLSWEAMGLLAYLLGRGDGFSMHFDALAKEGHRPTTKTIPAMFRELQDAGFVQKRRVTLPNGASEWQAVVSDRSNCKDTLQVPSPVSPNPPAGFVEKPAKPATVAPSPWPKGLNRKQIATLEEAGYDPQTAALAKPADLLTLPGVAAGTVKLLTGIDIRTQLPAEQSAAQREIMDAYYKALGYSPAQQKTLVNGAREGAAAKRLAEAGYDASTVVACYRHFKADSFWSSRHLSLQHVATNISAWSQAGPSRPVASSVPRGAPIGTPWHPNPNIRAALMTMHSEGRTTSAALARWSLTWQEVYGEPEPANIR
jgi:hypothetical protein